MQGSNGFLVLQEVLIKLLGVCNGSVKEDLVQAKQLCMSVRSFAPDFQR